MKTVKRIGKIGFYVILFVCLVMFGISGYMMKQATESVGESVIVNDWGDGLPVDFEPPTAEETMLPETPEEVPVEAPIEIPDEGGATAGADAPAVITSGEPEIAVNVFANAVPGEITCAFSMDELVESKTFGDWRTHAGVDLAAELGDDVCVIADGTVSAIIEDPMMGQTVVVTHENGYASSYSNLHPQVLCSVGERVTLGTVIGTVGNTAVAESLEPSHLHLELTLDQEQIDPMSVLKQ